MARVSKAFLKCYEAMNENELYNPIVFVIDMINGFIREGALHDERINEITPNITALIKHEPYQNVFVCDAHPPKTREFHAYPAHCILGSTECEVIEELSPYIHKRMHKNSTNAFACEDVQSFFQDKKQTYNDIVITGCCSDICILQFALSVHAWFNEHNMCDKQVIVPINCIDTYHIENVHDAWTTNEFSIQNMAANGIRIVTEIKRG